MVKIYRTNDDIQEFNKNKDQFLITRKNLDIDFDIVLGKGASSSVYKGKIIDQPYILPSYRLFKRPFTFVKCGKEHKMPAISRL